MKFLVFFYLLVSRSLSSDPLKILNPKEIEVAVPPGIDYDHMPLSNDVIRLKGKDQCIPETVKFILLNLNYDILFSI